MDAIMIATPKNALVGAFWTTAGAEGAEGAQEHRSTGAQEYRSTGAQEHKSTGAEGAQEQDKQI